MTSRATSSLFDSEDILSEFDRTASQVEWRVYNRQQIDLVIRRLQESSSASVVSTVSRNDKSYHVKIIEQTFALYIEEFYVEWMFYTRIMKSQFKINQCDHFAIDLNDVKLVYVEIFLKREITIHMLWEIDVTARSDEERIWVEYKNFLKINVQRVFIRVENIYDKYLNYKQINKQFVMNYDVNRIALMIQLTSKLKFNSHKKLQNFIRDLLSKHRRFLARERDMHTKIEIFNRLKKIEDADYQNNQHNKQKIIETNINDDFNKRKRDDENLINEEDQFNKKSKININDNENSNNNEEDDKKLKFDNLNRNSIKFRLYRWIRVEFVVIKTVKDALNVIKTNMILTSASTRRSALFLQSLCSKSKRRKTRRFDILQSSWHKEEFSNSQ